jgi:hypothetical protein
MEDQDSFIQVSTLHESDSEAEEKKEATLKLDEICLLLKTLVNVQQKAAHEIKRNQAQMMNEVKTLQKQHIIHSIHWALNNTHYGTFEYYEWKKDQYIKLNSSALITEILQAFLRGGGCYVCERYVLTPEQLADEEQRCKVLIEMKRQPTPNALFGREEETRFEIRLVRQLFTLLGMEPKVVVKENNQRRAIFLF